jgi:hypothetical protein
MRDIGKHSSVIWSSQSKILSIYAIVHIKIQYSMLEYMVVVISLLLSWNLSSRPAPSLPPTPAMLVAGPIAKVGGDASPSSSGPMEAGRCGCRSSQRAYVGVAVCGAVYLGIPHPDLPLVVLLGLLLGLVLRRERGAMQA